MRPLAGQMKACFHPSLGESTARDLARHFGQGVLGLLVGGRVFVDEEHRTAQHHLLELPPSSGLCAFFQLADEHAQQVLERQGAAQHRGLALEQRRAEQAFQRAHQAPLVAFQVFAQGLAAVDRGAFLGVEEDYRGQGDLAVFQCDQRFHPGAPPADGGVGGAEVDAQGAGVSGVQHGGKVRRKKRPRSLRESARACSTIGSCAAGRWRL